MSDGAAHDTVDVGEIAGALRRHAGWIAGSIFLGALVAVLALWILPRSYETTATVLVRSSSNSAQSALSQLTGLGDLMPGLSGVGSTLDTEMEILTSRSVVGEVVDSLRLQARVTKPGGLAARNVFSDLRFEADLDEGVYKFEAMEGGYRIEGPNGSQTIQINVPVTIGGATLTLSDADAGTGLELELEDREDAIDRVIDDLSAEEATGEVIEIVFAASDPGTAAAVPNLMVEKFLARRRTVDRGTNQYRYEFLLETVDSMKLELALATGALRAHQERSGILDPELTGRTGVERAMEIQSELETVDVEARSLQQVMAQSAAGTLSPRELAAYPTFLRNPAINSVLESMLTLETDRVALLQTRTERDEEVMALTAGVTHLEGQLVSLSRDYLSGLEGQRAQLRQELTRYSGELASLPREAEESLRRQREVMRLSETLIVLEAQLVTARLSAVGEGGEVRPIDVARPPKRASFPSVPIFLLAGLLGGLVVGTVGALGAEYLGSSVQLPHHAALATGLPTMALVPGVPLLLGGLQHCRSVLVAAVGEGASSGVVAHQLARTTSLRGTDVALVDLEQAVAGSNRPFVAALPPGDEQNEVTLAPLDESEGDAFPVVRAAAGTELNPADVRGTLTQMEGRLALVLIATGQIDSALTTALLSEHRPVVLVVRSGGVSRVQLRDTAETLRKAGIMVAGVILHNGVGSGHTST